MSFYKLEYSVEPAEIGVFPQARLSPLTYQSGENSFALVDVPLEGRIETDFKKPVFMLEEHAKLIDLLAITPGSNDFMTLSPRAFDLLQQFNVDAWQTYEAAVEAEKVHYPYRLVHFTNSRNLDYIDWEKSVFGRTTTLQRDLIAEEQFKSYPDFYACMKSLFVKEEEIIVRKLVLREEVIDRDIFRLLFISTGLYVSNRLKTSFEEAAIIGSRFIPVENLGQKVRKETHPHRFE